MMALNTLRNFKLVIILHVVDVYLVVIVVVVVNAAVARITVAVFRSSLRLHKQKTFHCRMKVSNIQLTYDVLVSCLTEKGLRTED